MRIAIDGYEANVSRRVGSGRYAYEIIRHLYGLLERGNIAHSVDVYLPAPPLADMPKEAAFWTYTVVHPARFWTMLGLPIALRLAAHRPDVVFSPTHYMPRFVGMPRVVTIFDVSYLKFPEFFASRDLYQLVRWTAYSVRHAARILTISESTKNDIIKKYGIDGTIVDVTYPGMSLPDPSAHVQIDSLRKKYSLGTHYILSVGTIQPRKNFVRLIEAFRIFLQKNKQKFGRIELVIIGKKGWLYEDILAAPARLGLERSVRFLDFIPDDELPTLYQHALCFALPSLYEGFGLPVLEAMHYGCPVVVSNVSSLPEIAGKAGIYVDPMRTETIAEGLLTAVRQRNLIQGKTRIRLGVARAKEFTWQRAAQKTLEILQSV